ncbi:metalloregulator ArsR/SmtB family transcription factor [Patescibacteria group bacterium]|nr:metalloregulator ArsR/SmtB family transcription factor [Patescibacteria group bacterium]
MNDCSCKCLLSDNKTVKVLSGIAKVFSSKTKLKILLILLDREHCVCEIQECLSKGQSLISHHLADLVEAGWIRQRRGEDARQVFYSLTKGSQKKLEVFLKIGGETK